MLRDIYLTFGGVGTFFIALLMFLAFIGWMMAVTEAVTRSSLPLAGRIAIVVSTSLLPPLGILVTAWFIRQDRRAISRTMRAFKARASGSPAIESRRSAA
ncbi:MAG: hypothetical protein O3C45_10815 [Bacteroidetes bacterium]|nr:hypothetical protein [Bacteroidota bacterium]MDA0875535.1 hypothetical protein [Bacteroidota bacterium]